MSTLLDIPADLVYNVSCFISHPADHFALRSGNKQLASILNPVYVFTNVDHLTITFSSSDPICSSVSNIVLSSGLDLASVSLMIDCAVPGAIVLGLLNTCETDKFESIVSQLDIRHYLEILSASLYFDVRINYLVIMCQSCIRFGYVGKMLVGLALNIATDLVCVNMLNAYGVLYSDEKFHRAILFTALHRGLYESLTWIVKRAMVPLNQSFAGTYPIQIAVQSGNEKITCMLIKAGASTNCRYRNGHLPLLHTACSLYGIGMLSVLLETATDCCVRDFTGRTARQLVQSRIREMEAARNPYSNSVETLQDLHKKLNLLDRFQVRRIATY